MDSCRNFSSLCKRGRVCTVGLDVAQRSKGVSHSYTPLHLAVEQNQMQVATLLLQNGAKTNCFSASGDSPMHVAAFYGHTDMIQLLHTHHASTGECSWSFMFWCDCWVPVELRSPETGFSPLVVALNNKQFESVQFLLSLGADVNTLDSEGWGLLHYATAQNDIATLRFLLGCNAKAELRTGEGTGEDTALHIAVAKGFLEAVELLLACEEPDAAVQLVHAVNGLGRSSIHEAALRGRVKSLYVLLRAAFSVELRYLARPFADVAEAPDVYEADLENMSVVRQKEVIEAVRKGMVVAEFRAESQRMFRFARLEHGSKSTSLWR